MQFTFEELVDQISKKDTREQQIRFLAEAIFDAQKPVIPESNRIPLFIGQFEITGPAVNRTVRFIGIKSICGDEIQKYPFETSVRILSPFTVHMNTNRWPSGDHKFALFTIEPLKDLKDANETTLLTSGEWHEIQEASYYAAASSIIKNRAYFSSILTEDERNSLSPSISSIDLQLVRNKLAQEIQGLHKQKKNEEDDLARIQKEKQNVEEDLAKIQKQINEIAPDGLDNFETELNQKQLRNTTLTKRIEEMESEIRFFLPSNDNETAAKLNSEPFIRYGDFKNRLDHEYDEDVVVPFLMGLCTNQIITLYGPPGKGKTTFVSKMAKAIGARRTMICVQSNWTDSSDLLGYYSPIDKTYEGTLFVDALIEANTEWVDKKQDSRLHIICLDEMNLARVEYYFATFLSMLQLDENERWLQLLPSYIDDELNEVYETSQKNKENRSTFEKNNLNEKNEYLWRLRKYRKFKLPPNIRFIGTINNDDTTNELSPKVRDRCLFIDLSSVEHSKDRGIAVSDYYPLAFFKASSTDKDYLREDLKNENHRFQYYAEQMLSWVDEHLPEYVDEPHNIKSIIYKYLVKSKILPLLRNKNAFGKYKKYVEIDEIFQNHAPETLGEYFDLLGGYK